MKKNQPNQDIKNVDKKESDIVTKESLCAVCALFSLIVLLILCTRSLIFGSIGVWVHSVLIGAFGYLAYPLFMLTTYVSVTSLIGIKLIKNRKAMVWLTIMVLSIALLLHTAITYSWPKSGYLTKCFNAGEDFPASTVCGFFGGLIVFILFSITTKVGAIVIFSALILFSGYLSYVLLKGKNVGVFNKNEKTKKELKNEDVPTPVEIPLTNMTGQSQGLHTASNPYPLQEVTATQQPAYRILDEGAPSASNTSFSPFGVSQTMPKEEQNEYENSREFLFGGSPIENFRRNLIFDPNAKVNQRPGYSSEKDVYTSSYSESYQKAVNEGEIERPTKIFTDYSSEIKKEDAYSLREETQYTPIQPIQETFERNPDIGVSNTEKLETQSAPEQPGEYKRHEYMELFSPDNPNLFGADNAIQEAEDDSTTISREADRGLERETFSDSIYRGRDIFDDEPSRNRIEEQPNQDAYSLRSDFNEPRTFREERTFTEDAELSRRFEVEEDRTPTREFERDSASESLIEDSVVAPATTPAPPPPPKPRIIRPYVRVPLDDFDCRDVEPTSNLLEVEETKANILATLDDFKVTGASIASVTFGPTVTRYNVTIPRNISPRKVVALDQSIAISLHSAGVNIYPNYEDGVVSIEVPNKDRQFVQLGCMLTGDTFVNAKPSSLMFTMGKDVGNRKVYGDISKMIHLLVAGSSGSGKSVFLGSLIVSMIYKYSPEELRLILIDPKKTEFVLYNDLPHLMINEIITDVNKAVQSLNWAIGEMNRRYGLFEQMSRSGTYVVNLDQYNSHLDKADRLPKIVIIIDELADLMLAAKKEIEDRIQNLTQKARAAGIHLIVATQRPSIDVITGVIKSNLPTRIAFAVATDVDSRVILDQTGAQKLLGKGDFLYTMQGINTPVRVQSAFISAEDSQRVVNFIKANNEAYYDESATAYINNTRSGGDGDSFGGNEEVEAVYIEALRFVIISGSASISMIQRKCSVGYNKAGKIVEWMEDMGYISSFDGAKARKVLITKEEFESKYGSL